MGNGKKQVHIKKSYEKTRQTCKIHTISHKFCKKKYAALKNVVKVKVVNHKHITHLHRCIILHAKYVFILIPCS